MKRLDMNDIKTKERMLLVFNVAYQGKVSAQVARDLHRCKAWACEWLKRLCRWIKKLDRKAVDHPRYLKRSYARLRKN